MSQVSVGASLPDFTVASTQGDITAASFKGQWTVLYFYPKDHTPGCTTEAQGFRDHYAEFQKAGCRIIGVSRDSLKTHGNFIEKQSLPFPLIADTDEALCTLFGVMKLKNMYGKQVRGIERSTFLVDPQGVLVREWRGLRVPGHVEEVLETLQKAS